MQEIKAWALQTGALVKTLEARQDGIEAIAFTPPLLAATKLTCANGS